MSGGDMTQVQWLRAELEKGRSLTQIQMLSEGGIGNHTGRISDLRRELQNEGSGAMIVVGWENGSNGKTWAKYSLFKPVSQLSLV
jgi:hypothetical protein